MIKHPGHPQLETSTHYREKGSAMPEEEDWITAVMAAAKTNGVSVSADVWGEIERILRGRLGESQLTVSERERTARRLMDVISQAHTDGQK